MFENNPLLRSFFFYSTAFLFLGFYILGWNFPDLWWGSHALAFLSMDQAWVIFIGTGLLAWVISRLSVLKFGRFLVAHSAVTWVLISLSTISAGMLFYHYPLVLDVTGDALRFEGFFAADAAFKPTYLSAMLDLNVFHYKNGERTVLNGVHFLASYFAVEPRTAFAWVAAFFGAMYVLTCLLFVKWVIMHHHLWVLMLLLLAPYTWQFFGHMEIYAPAIWVVTAYLTLLIANYQQASKFKFVVLLLLLYLAIKVHTVHFFLVPSLLMMGWFQFRPKQHSVINWFNVAVFGMIPLAVVGLFVYFFVFADHVDPRTLAKPVEQIFLPLYQAKPPLDNYSLFSANHFFDYFNMLLMLSAAALFGLIAYCTVFRKITAWSSPLVVILGATLIIYLGFFFVFNPLLGMPLDLDLYSIAGPVLVLFVVVLMPSKIDKKIDHKIQQNTSLVLILLSLLTIPYIWVNQNTTSKSQLLTSLGVRTFQSYWMGATRPMIIAMDHYLTDQTTFENYLTALMTKLDTHVTDQNDIEYSELMRHVAGIYQHRFNDDELSMNYLLKSFYQNAGNKGTAMALMENHFKAERYEKAYGMAQYLLIMRVPNYQKNLRMLIHTAIMADYFASARLHAQEYLLLWPEDEFIQTIFQWLVAGDKKQELKSAFVN